MIYRGFLLASIEIPEVYLATKTSATITQVLGSVAAAVEHGLNSINQQLPEHLLASDGDLNELTFTVHEDRNRGKLKEAARAYRVLVHVEVEELRRGTAHNRPLTMEQS